jgi:hypothetical protein
MNDGAMDKIPKPAIRVVDHTHDTKEAALSIENLPGEIG